jgi:peptidoglycan/LPS O-acetylase OafA/YrhL
MQFGTLGVFIFFIISGYLITESYLRDSLFSHFFIKRAFRIVPGLWVAILLSALILGPLLTIEPLSSYFTDSIFYKYIRSLWFFKLAFELPGLFLNNPYAKIVNGSLWSIPIEFSMYILVFLCGKLNFIRLKPLLSILLLLILLWLFLPRKQLTEYLFDMNKAELLKCGLMFFMGAFLQICAYKKYVKYLQTSVFILSITVLTCFLLPTSYGQLLLFFTLPPIVIYLAFAPWLKSQKLFTYGDFSYGIYLYAFPVQQTVIYFYINKISLAEYIFVSAIITLGFGIMSWFLVEKPLVAFSRKLLLKSK